MSIRELEFRGDDGRRFVPAHVIPESLHEDEDSEDKALTLAFKRGERDAYRAIYQRYSPRVYGVCRRMLLQPEDAEEAAQESFLRVYQALARFNGRYLLGPWITRITTNVCLDHLRAKSRRPVDLMPVDALELHGGCEQDDLDPEHLHLRTAEGRRVRRLLGTLPPMYRAAIVLRDFEGLSYAEVATALEITESQTKALIHRARQAFKRSWSSVLLAAPLRFLHKLRRLDPSAKEQGGQAVGTLQQTSDAMGSAAQMASSCSTMVQQCGHFFAERAVTVAAAVTIGAAGAAGVVMTHPSPSPQPQTRAPITLTRDDSKPAHQSKIATRAARRERPAADEGVPKPATSPETTTTEAPPAEEPAPEEPAADPTDAPAPAADPEDDGTEPSASPSPAESPSPLPPEGFALAFLMNGTSAPSCACARPNDATSSSVGATSAGLERFDQVLEGTVQAPAGQYGLWVHHLSQAGTSHAFDLRVATADGGYFYSGEASLVDRTLLPWSGWQYTYKGTYHLTSRPGGSGGMPATGTYTAVVSASWQENRIVSTSFSLDADS